jgi:cell division protein FtsZ
MASRFSAASVAGRMAVARAFDAGHVAQRTPHSYREPAPAPLQPAVHADHHDHIHEHETAIDDVTLRPLPPRPSFFEPMQDDEQAELHEEEPIQPFLPPRPERAGTRAARMPRIDELPMPAQNEIRASRGEPAEHERKRTSLLQRLAKVGLGRREEPEAEYEPHQLAPAPRHEEEHEEREYRPAPDRRTSEQVSEYSRRPAGRPAAIDSPARNGRTRIDDDELEIPAFLRRQAN